LQNINYSSRGVAPQCVSFIEPLARVFSFIFSSNVQARGLVNVHTRLEPWREQEPSKMNWIAKYKL